MGLGVDNKSKLLSIGMIVTGILYIPGWGVGGLISKISNNEKKGIKRYLLILFPLIFTVIYLYCSVSLYKYYDELLGGINQIKERGTYNTLLSKHTASFVGIVIGVVMAFVVIGVFGSLL